MPTRPTHVHVLALAVALLAGLGTTGADAAKRKKAAKAPATSAACTDFYADANATWLAANPAPAADATVSALGQLQQRAIDQQRALLDAAMQSPQDTVQTLLGDFWASGLDEPAVERDGANPIAPLLSRIDGIRRSRDVPAAIAALHQVGIPVAFNFAADVDLEDLSRHIGYFSQGGLGLPDPAYYTRTDAGTRAVLGQYVAYVQKILALTGVPQDKVAEQAQQVVDLETRIAQASRPLAGLRDPRSDYALVPIKGLDKQYPHLKPEAFLQAQGVGNDTVSIANPALFAQLDTLVDNLKPAQWKAYLRWRVGDAMAPYLSKAYRDAEFAFRGRVLRGETTPPPRWRQVLDAIDVAAGPMLGHEYAARYLPAATRAQAEAVAGQVRDALAAAIDANAWMDAAAKAQARQKLSRLRIEVGTPPRDLDYTIQPMGRGSFGGNMLIASTWRHREEMRRIGIADAGRRWAVSPQTPSIAYDLALNRLVVTAAMLQPPVFDPAQDVAAQYGAFGALVGHELSHGFDERGRMVDGGGSVGDWWTPADVDAWNGLATRIAAQYDTYAYPGIDDAKVDGDQVRGEAMADQSGVELAWAAFTKAQPAATDDGKKAFFRAWAQLWAQQDGSEAAKLRAATDVHAPGRWRANGPLMDQPAFGAAYSCKADTPMQWPQAEQVAIWR